MRTFLFISFSFSAFRLTISNSLQSSLDKPTGFLMVKVTVNNPFPFLESYTSKISEISIKLYFKTMYLTREMQQLTLLQVLLFQWL